MTYQVSNKPIEYNFTIYPFADSNRKFPVIISNNSNLISGGQFSPVYRLESFSFSNDIFEPIQKGSARIILMQYKTIDFFKYVKEADLLFITENNKNIFSGYIESMDIDLGANGTTIVVNFVNLIQQISVSKIFGNIINTLQIAQSFKFSQFLSEVIKNTLISATTSISGNVPFKFLSGQGENSSTILNASNTVFVTITAYMSILQSINKIIFPYQRFIYQDSTGSIVIAPLSLYNDFIWQFDQVNDDNNETSDLFPYLNISVKKNAGGSYNQGYGTLFNIPIALSPASIQQFNLQGFACAFSPSSTYFQRLTQLYNSGNFTMTDITIEDVISDPNKLDQTLVNISELIQGLKVSSSIATTISVLNQTPSFFPQQIPLTNSSGGQDVSAILYNYVSRILAEALLEETKVAITTPRVSQVDVSGNLLPLPINQIVNVYLDDGILEKSNLFCRGYNLSYSTNGTIVTLNLCKPLTGGSYWVNGPLVSV